MGEQSQDPGLDGRGPVIARRFKMLVVKVSRFRPGQLEPEALVASSDQELCREILALIRERLAREEGRMNR
jgi:hypothetical protein